VITAGGLANMRMGNIERRGINAGPKTEITRKGKVFKRAQGNDALKICFEILKR